MTENTTPTIAVFAATGSQGGAVADALLAQGATVRALVRDTTSNKAKALADRGVELTRIDVGDSPTLAAALSGVQAF